MVEGSRIAKVLKKGNGSIEERSETQIALERGLMPLVDVLDDIRVALDKIAAELRIANKK